METLELLKEKTKLIARYNMNHGADGKFAPTNGGGGSAKMSGSTKTVDIDQEYNSPAPKAIKQFFNKHPELSYWQDDFNYMAENNIEHIADDKYADGSKKEWTYSLWLDQYDGTHTYIAITERKPVTNE